MNNIAHPEFFLLLILPFFAFWGFPAVKEMYGDAIKLPFIAEIENIKKNTSDRIWKKSDVAFLNLKRLLLLLSYICLVCALCRPQWVGEPIEVRNEGRNIMLVVDISPSMQTEDFRYNGRYYDRLSIVKQEVSEFVDKRIDDRIGLILFGTRAYMQVPLTYDKQTLKEVLWATDPGMAGDSTSMGDALGVALKNLINKEDIDNEKDNKIIILLTDGESNDGSVSVPQAFYLAKEEKVKVYVIGVGNDGTFLGALMQSIGANGYERSLMQLSEDTRGRYFRAKDASTLNQVYHEIDKLEPQKLNNGYVQEVREYFYIPALMSLLLLSIVFIMLKQRIITNE